MLNYTVSGEILQDKKNGKENDWQGKKIKSLKVSASFARLKSFRRSENINNCGSWLKFMECSYGHHKKLVGASFCRDRLCPTCNWRRSLMLTGQLMQMIHVAINRRKMRFIFLTLTVRNIEGEKLSKQIDELFKGFKELLAYKKVDKNIIGWIRNLEVTHNEQEDTYHPHFHCLIAVPESYFNGSNYIKQSEWTDLWRKAMKLDYIPQVNVKAVKANKEGKTVESAVAETAKYSVKDSEYIKDSESDTDKLIEILALALRGRRLIGFGKLFRQIRKELKLKDVESESADLVGADKNDCTCPVCQSNLEETLYSWNYGLSQFMRSDY